jgi:hypothetical protein
MLLEGLKDELFDLEVEHKQGRISQQEYEKTKSCTGPNLGARFETRVSKSLIASQGSPPGEACRSHLYDHPLGQSERHDRIVLRLFSNAAVSSRGNH